MSRLHPKVRVLAALLPAVLLLLSFSAASHSEYTDRDPRRELKDLLHRVDEGDAESIYILATLHDRGFDTIPVDSVRSTELYRLAAEKGYAPAMNYLGYRLISGDVAAVGRDAEEGLMWLEKAAEAGDIKAASNIGWLLIEGKDVPQDLENAARWLAKAADGGLPIAQSLLGDLYRDGRGVAADTVTADSLYRAAFEAGMPDAGYKRAALNEERYKGFTPEEALEEGKYYYFRYAPSEGVKLFYQAADEGNAEAMALLGDAYTRAVGVPYDHSLSIKYYTKAALRGNPAAQFIIGELLEIFPDALNDLDPNDEFFTLPAEGDAEVQTLSKDPFYWYEKAAEAGITNAEEASSSLR